MHDMDIGKGQIHAGDKYSLVYIAFADCMITLTQGCDLDAKEHTTRFFLPYLNYYFF